jgi:hypothetical protein
VTSTATDIWAVIAEEAAAESQLWAEALLPVAERRADHVFSPLGPRRFALGIETIYEGYLLHYGSPRLFRGGDRDTSLLLGDYLYAHGLVRIAQHDEAAAVADLAELISLCAQLRAERADGEGSAWAATAALLGRDGLAEARSTLRDEGDLTLLHTLAVAAAGEDAVHRSLALHESLVR